MRFPKEHMIGIGIAACAGAILGVYLFLYMPLIHEIKLKGLECRLAESEVSLARSSVAAFRSAAKRNTFIQLEEVSAALDEVTHQGRTSGVSFSSITPGQAERGQGEYQVLPVDMETVSSYDGLGLFLGALDDLDKSLVTVRTCAVVADDKDPSRVKSKLTLNLYLKV